MNTLSFGGISRLFVGLKGFYSGINGATLTGAIDVVIVEQEDGSFKCTPFHVRFGKLGVLHSKEKVVDIEVNGVPVPIRMKLGDSGEAFFVEECEFEDDWGDGHLATSPLPSSPRSSDSDITSPHHPIECPQLPNSATTPGVLISTTPPPASKDEKGRKRRKKRRKTQGSKSDIIVNLNTLSSNSNNSNSNLNPNGGSSEEERIFTMDEEMSSRVAEALSKLDLMSSTMGNIPHSRSFHREFYSDTEVDGITTPQNSRPSTPIQSDSEYEISKIQIESEENEEVGKWAWGELPSPGTHSTPQVTPHHQVANLDKKQNASPQKSSSDENPLSSDDEGSRGRMRSSSSENRTGLISNIFSYMKRNNRGGGGGEQGSECGMYLDDINPESMDPTQFALYFPNVIRDHHRTGDHDEDVESGKGSSLPQSPLPGSPRSVSSFPSHFSSNQNVVEGVEGGGESHKFEAISLCGSNLALFEQSRLTYDDLSENPDIILKSPPDSIVVKIDGKYLSWASALPQLLSTTFFQRPLPDPLYQKLLTQFKKEESLNANGSSSLPLTTQNVESTNFKEEKKSFGWSFWRRSNAPNSTSPPPPHSTTIDIETHSNTIQNSSPDKLDSKFTYDLSQTEEFKNAEIEKNSSSPPLPIPGSLTPGEKFKKTLRLSSEQIKSLGLKSGQNEARFSVTTAYQGTTEARCHIYLWRYDDRIVVSDIDGTITKSDVLGHVLPMIGQAWAQSGVAQLFTQIVGNGYKMLYLSSRSIGQASQTKSYLKSICQDDVMLPDGPLLLNPASLMAAFHREVIERKPEKFKIDCLKDVQALFPSNPFYAGYGNRINDVWAYRAVEIYTPRIFTINHRGELRHALTNSFQSSYTNLLELVNLIFPVYKDEAESQVDGFSNFEYWRDPIPELPPN